MAVSCDHLLRSVAADGSGPGAEIQPYLDDGLPGGLSEQNLAVLDWPCSDQSVCSVPDSLLLRVLETRLSRMDCICRGWILHDFPQNLQQARSLQESQHQPNRWETRTLFTADTEPVPDLYAGPGPSTWTQPLRF